MAIATGAGCTDARERDTATARTGVTTSALAGCTTTGEIGAWQNQGFPDQRTGFQIEIDATPSASTIDAVVGLSDGPSGSFPHLAAAVRFNTSGGIDVRSGSSYIASVFYPWTAGTSYRFRLRVDMTRKQYQVEVRPTSGGSYVQLAFANFRSEQRDVPVLGNVASVVDGSPDPSASLQVCAAEPVFAAPFGCYGAAAGQGFTNVPLPRADVLDTVTFEVTASEPGIDAVIGLTEGPASQFSDLAAAFRFAPGGTLDARDGDDYRADLDVAYGTKTIDFRIIADLTRHRFSAFEGDYRPEFSIATGDRFARDFQFRPSQANVSALANLALVVDGDHGNIVLCGLSARPSSNVAYSRDGRRSVFPFPDGGALLSDGSTTTRVDPAGTELAAIALTGAMAADPAGATYIARIVGTTLSIAKLDAALQLQTTTTLDVPPSSSVGALAVDAGGALRFAVTTTTSAGRTATVSRLAVDGTVTTELTVPGFVVFDGEETFAINNTTSVLQISRLTATGEPIWSREFAGNVSISPTSVDPDHNIVFGGTLNSAINFGGATLQPDRTEHERFGGFVVKLASNGDHVFSQRLDASVSGVATNGARILVSSTRLTDPFSYARLRAFLPDGTQTGLDYSSGFDEEGLAGSLAMNQAGRVWWNLSTSWPLFPDWDYLLSFTP